MKIILPLKLKYFSFKLKKKKTNYGEKHVKVYKFRRVMSYKIVNNICKMYLFNHF